MSNIQIYQSDDGKMQVEVKFEQDTVWLDARMIARLFGVQRPAIVKHISNIYKTGELENEPTCSILEHVAGDGKTRKMNFYNLDMIISVGYKEVIAAMLTNLIAGEDENTDPPTPDSGGTGHTE